MTEIWGGREMGWEEDSSSTATIVVMPDFWARIHHAGLNVRSGPSPFSKYHASLY